MKQVQFTIIVALVFFGFSPALAGMDAAYKVYEKKGAFEEVFLDLQDAVVDKGLLIDYTGHVGLMLERTGKATGKESVYKYARYFMFCSAKLTQAATKADPNNIALCPYTVFAYELKARPGVIRVGYRFPVAGKSEASLKALADLNSLLDGIVKKAVE